MKYKKFLPVIVAGSGILLLLTMRYWKVSSTRQQAAELEHASIITARTFQVTRVDFQDILTTVGNVKGKVDIDLKFEKEGRLASFRFKEGDFVKEGEVIASLDASEAKLKKDHAEVSYEENRKLLAIGSIGKAKLEQVRLETEMAKLDYQKHFLKAPASGYLTQKNVEVGEMITPHVKIAGLVDVRQVIVELGIIEKDVEKIKIGLPLSVAVDSYPGTKFSGKITHISPQLEGKSRTLSVKATVENPKGLLLPGMFARCELVVFSQPQALPVPNSSLTQEGEGLSVFLLQANNSVLKHPVTVTYASEEYTLVSDGLSEGDIICMDKPEGLTEGKRIESLELLSYGQPETKSSDSP